MAKGRVALVDYGMGNLFSVSHACERAGLAPFVTSSPKDVRSADGVVLPGVGAFGDAMETLSRLGLAEELKAVVASGKPFLGVCLGQQLLMSESHEFGAHRGLGVIEGDVVRFQGSPACKVPEVGWNRLRPPAGRRWEGSALEGLPADPYMYFVHSFYVRPASPAAILSVTDYAGTTYCSSLEWKNVFACQFHPERSGPLGLKVYGNFAARVARSVSEGSHV